MYFIQVLLVIAWKPMFFWFQRQFRADVIVLVLCANGTYLTALWNQIDPVAATLNDIALWWFCYVAYTSVSTTIRSCAKLTPQIKSRLYTLRRRVVRRGANYMFFRETLFQNLINATLCYAVLWSVAMSYARL